MGERVLLGTILGMALGIVSWTLLGKTGAAWVAFAFPLMLIGGMALGAAAGVVWTVWLAWRIANPPRDD